MELGPGEHRVTYELTHYALRQAGFEELARRQHQSCLEVHLGLLAEAAEAEGIRWTVPLPVLTRYLNAVLDGLILRWLVDRKSEEPRGAASDRRASSAPRREEGIVAGSRKSCGIKNRLVPTACSLVSLRIESPRGRPGVRKSCRSG
ncbi:TetR family transcriptional regulator C-terminal domain-containing protein [Streptomyces sp. NPDC013187]|uniref:TetR family transcriptional regulator C-terminal domain-containing protein n=1 Tax=Streptomyces sp. NPDC013187 TaxID=3364865 RepID=UPI0036B91C65